MTSGQSGGSGTEPSTSRDGIDSFGTLVRFGPPTGLGALRLLRAPDRAPDVRDRAAGILYEMYLAGFEELSRDEAALKSIRYRKDELYREQWGLK